MKKIFVVLMVLFLGISFVSAAAMNGPEAMKGKPKAAAKAANGVMTLKGTIIDNMCAMSNMNKMSEFIKKHTKECALMPNCAASGYSIYTTDEKLISFDKPSSKKVMDFLKKKDSRLQVVVRVKKAGDELQLISIKNSVDMKAGMKPGIKPGVKK